MATKSGSSGKEKLIDEEEVLQAVILADSFNKRFRPLTARKPRCLLPICNAPLLDWTFESLALAGVQEVFVVCRSHAELVKDAIKDSKWSKPGSGMKIVPIMTAKETFSPGDAMRDMYTRGLVTSDFVLVMGDLVSNIRIDEVVRVHKERRRTNKDAIMTMVVKESGERHRTRAKGESAVFVLDPETNECLHYEHVQGYPRTKGINIPREILAAHPEVDIRNDLLDCSIDVCSVEVPSLFQDNFDYLDIRRDFVHGILTSDILMKNIYCYVAEDGYAARVQDTRSYESISKDILSRWTFPLVPDDNHPGGHIYELTRGNRYIAKGNTVELSRTCNVGKNTLIGASTTVAENVTIVASVIGQNCRIGAGSIVRNSYLFEGAVIGKGCTVERSIIGADVQIKDRTHVARGCLIGEGVVVGPDAVLQSFERLSKKRSADDVTADEDDDDSDIEEVEANQDSVDKSGLGKDSNAIVWPRGPPADEDDDEEGPENYKNQRFMRLGDDASDIEEDLAASSSSDSDSDTESDSSGAFDAYGDRDSISGHSDLSLTTSALEAGAGGGLGLMADAEFRTEVTQSLARAFAEGHSVDNAAVELKTLRMASNVPLARVKEAVIAAVVERIPLVEGDVGAQRREIGQVVGRWGDLINRIGGVDPVETVVMLQAHCASSTRMPLFGQILAALYQADIVEEDDIRAWHGLPASRAEGDMDDADKERFRKLSAAEVENLRKCWMIGTHMIQQFDAQGSDTETETESEDEEVGKEKGTAKKTEREKDTESESDSEGEETRGKGHGIAMGLGAIAAVAASAAAGAAAGAVAGAGASVSESESDSESEGEEIKGKGHGIAMGLRAGAAVAASAAAGAAAAGASASDSDSESEDEAKGKEHGIAMGMRAVAAVAVSSAAGAAAAGATAASASVSESESESEETKGKEHGIAMGLRAVTAVATSAAAGTAVGGAIAAKTPSGPPETSSEESDSSSESEGDAKKKAEEPANPRLAAVRTKALEVATSSATATTLASPQSLSATTPTATIRPAAKVVAKAPAVESSSGESGSEDEESSRGNTQDGESDDGMSDAVSASEGASSVNPSTNASANVSEDEGEGPQ